MRKNKTDFLGGPVLEIPCFHCRGHRFDPRLGKFHMLQDVVKKGGGGRSFKKKIKRMNEWVCVSAWVWQWADTANRWGSPSISGVELKSAPWPYVVSRTDRRGRTLVPEQEVRGALWQPRAEWDLGSTWGPEVGKECGLQLGKCSFPERDNLQSNVSSEKARVVCIHTGTCIWVHTHTHTHNSRIKAPETQPLWPFNFPRLTPSA